MIEVKNVVKSFGIQLSDPSQSPPPTVLPPFP